MQGALANMAVPFQSILFSTAGECTCNYVVDNEVLSFKTLQFACDCIAPAMHGHEGLVGAQMQASRIPCTFNESLS